MAEDNITLKDASDLSEAIELAPQSDGGIETEANGDGDGDGGLDRHSSSLRHSPTSITPSTMLQTKDSHRIDPKRCGGFCRGYVRQDWDTIVIQDGVDELRAGWVELFFDLIYVAAIVHLSTEAAYAISDDDYHRRRLAGDSSPHHSTTDTPYGTAYSDNYDSHDYCYDEWQYSFLLTAFAEFGLLITAWRTQVQYITHFVFNQAMDEIIKLLFMICILCMGIFIKDDIAYDRAFLISYGMLQLVIIIMFSKVLLIPRGKYHGIWFIGQAVVTLIIVIIIAPTLDDACNIDYFAIFVALYIFDNVSIYASYIFSAACKLEPRIAIPLNVPHIAERYGLFIMLILGESIISVMTTDLVDLDLEQKFVWSPDGTPPSQILVIFLILAFILAWTIGRLYYDCQPPEEAIMQGHNNHALRISARAARTYMMAHSLLFFGLLGLGVGIKITGKHLFDEERRWIDTVLPTYSLVIILIALNLIRIAHPYRVHPKIWIIRGILLLIMCIVPIFTMDFNNGVLFGVVFLCVFFQLFLDVEGREKIKIEKEEMKEKREIAKQETEREEKSKTESRFKHFKKVTSGIGLM